MPTGPDQVGTAVSLKKQDEETQESLVPRAHIEPQRIAPPLPSRQRALLPARDLFLHLPALVEADAGVSGLFFHDSFDQYRELVQANPDPQAIKTRALALLAFRDQIEGRFLSALSDVLEWHRRLQELARQGCLTPEELGSGE